MSSVANRLHLVYRAFERDTPWRTPQSMDHERRLRPGGRKHPDLVTAMTRQHLEWT